MNYGSCSALFTGSPCPASDATSNQVMWTRRSNVVARRREFVIVLVVRSTLTI